MLVDLEFSATVFGLAVSVAIVWFYALAAYFTFRWLKKSKRHYYYRIKMMYFIMYVLFAGMFIAIAVSSLIGNPLVPPTSFGAIAIRPIILIAGVLNAVAARARYLSLIIGERTYGEH